MPSTRAYSIVEIEPCAFRLVCDVGTIVCVLFPCRHVPSQRCRLEVRRPHGNSQLQRRGDDSDPAPLKMCDELPQ